MEIRLPNDVSRIINTLADAGYEAYAVGGCVRDSIMGREPADWDITTSALPEDVKRLFRRTVDTGIQHGTVTVMFKMKGYEVTTYRIDGNYSDGRHPDQVTFASDLEEDLKRRDFTVNAMAYNETDGLVDIFGGKSDLEEGVVRAVGEARERFKEDALRIMRAFRFAAQLRFRIDGETLKAAEELKDNLKNVSAERIRIELVKLITSPEPELLESMYKAGITSIFIPEFDRAMGCVQNNPHHCYNVGKHTIEAMKAFKNEEGCSDNEFEFVRLALLFHDLGKPECRTTDENGTDHFHGHSGVSRDIAADIMKRLKFDNNTIKTVCDLVLYHDIKPELQPSIVRKVISKTGGDIFRLLFYVQKADIMGQSDHKRDEKLEYLADLKKIYEQIIADGDPVTIRDLAVNGNDLKQMGIKAGPEMGIVLRQLLDMVLEDPSCNTKQKLMEKLISLKDREKQQ